MRVLRYIRRPHLTTVHWILLGITSLSLVLHLWGIRKNLPYIPEVDEKHFWVERAVNMAASGSLNPGWFGHPGSTVLYPLTAIYHIRYGLTQNSLFAWPDHNLQAVFDASPAEFYLLGRLLTVTYAVMSIPLIYLVGRQAFGAQVGLIGAWLFVFYPLAVYHAQIVRTDSAAVFFGMLSLWRILKVYDQPAKLNQLLAGLCIGLSIASRYFMVTLIPLLVVVDGLLLSCSTGIRKKLLISIGIGLVTVGITFALSTPYFFLDFNTALESIRSEARSSHVGADGLSRTGNFLWYLTYAIPRSITWPQLIVVAIGTVITLSKNQLPQQLLFGFVIVFLVAISLSSLHWQHWIIPTLPILALFASYGSNAVANWFANCFSTNSTVRHGLLVLCVLAISAWPAYRLILLDIQQANPSTRILAREWILENLPVKSKIAQEWYAAPLADTDFAVTERFSLATKHDLNDYYQEGYNYLIVSSAIYERYLSKPEDYPSEVSFYKTLFDNGRLLYICKPSNTRGGPIIRIYELQKGAALYYGAAQRG